MSWQLEISDNVRPTSTFKYDWVLVDLTTGRRVADSFADTKWGCRRGARKAIRRIEKLRKQGGPRMFREEI